MSTIKHPVGPQSSSVYWRRRLVVGLGLIAVLVIIFLIIVRPGSSSGEPQDKKSAAAGSSSDTAAGDTTGSAPDAPTEGATCDPSQVSVEAITDAVNYEPGLEPQLSLSITNTGTVACMLEVGTSQQVFTIKSGEDVYWTSTHCQSDPVDAQVSLEPGVPVSSSAPIVWDRTRSASDTCEEATRDAAPAGGASYYLSVSVAGIESEKPKQFLLY